ncbi:nuclear transport factor 2 family protein [Actinomadura craniellae]|nr:nuclear transport factor 2 family protein [Actinomadura craniellae]
MSDTRAELDVRNVIARIAHRSDAGDLTEYGDLFTADARWEMPGTPAKNGRAEIVAAAAARRAEGGTGPGSATRHLVGTTAVTVEGDTATAESYWQFYADTTTAPALRLMGHYHDTLRREADGWRVAHRQITIG